MNPKAIKCFGLRVIRLEASDTSINPKSENHIYKVSKLFTIKDFALLLEAFQTFYFANRYFRVDEQALSMHRGKLPFRYDIRFAANSVLKLHLNQNIPNSFHVNKPKIIKCSGLRVVRLDAFNINLK